MGDSASCQHEMLYGKIPDLTAVVQLHVTLTHARTDGQRQGLNRHSLGLASAVGGDAHDPGELRPLRKHAPSCSISPSNARGGRRYSGLEIPAGGCFRYAKQARACAYALHSHGQLLPPVCGARLQAGLSRGQRLLRAPMSAQAARGSAPPGLRAPGPRRGPGCGSADCTGPPAPSTAAPGAPRTTPVRSHKHAPFHCWCPALLSAKYALRLMRGVKFRCLSNWHKLLLNPVRE